MITVKKEVDNIKCGCVKVDSKLTMSCFKILVAFEELCTMVHLTISEQRINIYWNFDGWKTPTDIRHFV